MIKFIKLVLLLFAFCSEGHGAERFTCDFSNCTSSPIEASSYTGKCIFNDKTWAICKGNLTNGFDCIEVLKKNPGWLAAASAFSWGEEASSWFYFAFRALLREILIFKGVVDDSIKRDMLRCKFQKALDSGGVGFALVCPSFFIKLLTTFCNVPDWIEDIIPGILPVVAGAGQLFYDGFKIIKWVYYKCSTQKREERDFGENKKFLSVAEKKLKSSSSSLSWKEKEHLLVEIRAVLEENLLYCLRKEKDKEIELCFSYLDGFELNLEDLDISEDQKGRLEAIRHSIHDNVNETLNGAEDTENIQTDSSSDTLERQSSQFSTEGV